MEDKMKLIDDVISGVNKKYGRPIAFRASDAGRFVPRKLIPTGCFALDRIIGGGVPVGLSTELYGNAGCGKTTLALSIMANALKMDPSAVGIYMATEGDFPDATMELLGVDPSRVIVIRQAEFGEQALNVLRETIQKLVAAGVSLPVAVIDSLAGVLPAREAKGVESDGLEHQSVGSHSAMSSKMYRVLFGTGMMTNTALIVVNQPREQISSAPTPQITTGGRANEHWNKLRIKMTTSKARQIHKSDLKGMEEIPGFPNVDEMPDKQPVGHVIDIEVVKNNTGRGKPGAQSSARVIYGYGFENWTAVVDAAIFSGIVVQRGSSYRYGDLSVVGKNAFIARLVETNQWEKLESAVKATIATSDVEMEDELVIPELEEALLVEEEPLAV